MVKGWIPVSVREGLIKKLEQIYQNDNKRPKNQKFTSWFDNMLTNYTSYYDKLEGNARFMEFVGAFDNNITIYDYKENSTVTLFINSENNELQCEKHKTNDCLHVGFCYAIPQVYVVLIEKGFKPK
ncbi:MAG: hypothetical protein ACR2F1_07870 [Nitrososphaeraceae archaeon]